MPMSDYLHNMLTQKLFDLSTLDGDVWIGPYSRVFESSTTRYRADAEIESGWIRAIIQDPGPYEWRGLDAGSYSIAIFTQADGAEPPAFACEDLYRITPGDTLTLADREVTWGLRR